MTPGDPAGVSPASRVTLREIDASTVRTVCGLAVREDQRGFVAPNALSIAEGHFSPHAWFRAIYADETPVGFVMVEDVPGKLPYLWRFMIDARYQHFGFGRGALEQVITRLSTGTAAAMETSVVQSEGGPQPFYERLGFVATGVYEDGEAVLRLVFPEAGV